MASLGLWSRHQPFLLSLEALTYPVSLGGQAFPGVVPQNLAVYQVICLYLTPKKVQGRGSIPAQFPALPFCSLSGLVPSCPGPLETAPEQS